MGASIQLYNRYDRMVQQVFSTAEGRFAFDSLLPDLYSVRVSLSSFMPATRRNIAIQPGTTSILTINLASVLSSIELVYAAPNPGTLMTDDWKWVLRTSPATRPVMRYTDGETEESPAARHSSAPVLSDLRGMVRVSAGDPGEYAGGSNPPDMGTAFAIAASVFGASQLLVSGNVGYTSHSGIPASGFRMTLSRDQALGSRPEITISMRQLYLPARGIPGQQDMPTLRTMALSMADQAEILENLRLDYGVQMETVSFNDRINSFSPFARLTWSTEGWGAVAFGYSRGSGPVEPVTHQAGDTSLANETELHQDLAALSRLPRLSMADGRARIQSTESFELGYQKKSGSRTYAAALYRDNVNNGTVTMAGPADLYPNSDILPDLASRSAVFNIGHYRTSGFMASVRQLLGERSEVAVAYGRGGALSAHNRQLETTDPDELRSRVRPEERSWASMRASTVIPVTGTQITSSYGWGANDAVVLTRRYTTNKAYPDRGWNVQVRQPIPNVPGIPGRIEATAELRNALAEGYLGLATADGRRVLLTNSPRALRGGLNFIF